MDGWGTFRDLENLKEILDVSENLPDQVGRIAALDDRDDFQFRSAFAKQRVRVFDQQHKDPNEIISRLYGGMRDTSGDDAMGQTLKAIPKRSRAIPAAVLAEAHVHFSLQNPSSSGCEASVGVQGPRPLVGRGAKPRLPADFGVAVRPVELTSSVFRIASNDARVSSGKRTRIV